MPRTTNPNTVMTIRNGNVLFPDGALRSCDISIGNGVISELGESERISSAIDAAGAYIVPGLIDIHTHGLGFLSTNESSLIHYADMEAERGVTTFFPTLFAPPDKIVHQLQRHRLETDELQKAPQVGGFRLESPYLAGTGAGLSRDLAPISDDLTRLLLEAGHGHIRIWDISPELSGAPELIHSLSQQGILCSLAHTHATIEQAQAAVDAGARLVTHLFDTFDVPEMTDPGVFPISLIDYLLIEDSISCEIIADGAHVHPLQVEKAFRCKTPDRLVFVTDSILGAGLPPGQYDLPDGWGRVVVNGSNNGVRMVDRLMGLAGSALTAIDAFRNCVSMFGKDLVTASAVCSKNPAKLLGLNTGEIAVGKDADLVILDADLTITHTLCKGKVVYQAHKSEELPVES